MAKVQFQVDGLDSNTASIFNDDVTFDGNVDAASISIGGTDIANIYASQSYVDTAVSNLPLLPEQSGNSGKYLTTDGTTSSWSSIASGSSDPNANIFMMMGA